MIALFISAFCCAFLMLSLGITFSKFLKIPATFIEKLALGLVVGNTLASITSIFFPLNSLTLGVFLGIAVLLLPFIKTELAAYSKSIAQHKKLLFLTVPFIVLAFLIALSPPQNYDTALYHLPSIKWIEAYPVVPGLANLHGRLGFNSNIFSFFALTSVFNLFEQEIFSVHLVVLWGLFLYFFKRFLEIYEQEGYSKVFFFNLFIFLRILLLGNLEGPSPDFLAAVIPLFIYVRAWDLLQNSKTHFQDFLPILILSIYVLTVKLAAIPLAVIVLFILWKYRTQLFPSLWKIIALSIIIIAPWLVRNVILTGWLIYPFEALDLFDFDWKIPLEDVVFESMIIKGAGRMPGSDCLNFLYQDFSEWFPTWWYDKWPNEQIAFILAVSMPVIALVKIALQKQKQAFIIPAVFCVNAYLGLIFWFLMAPAWRFGEPFILLAVTAPILVLGIDDKTTTGWKKILGSLFYLCLLCYDVSILILLILGMLLLVSVDVSNTLQERLFGVTWATLVLLYGIYFRSSLLFHEETSTAYIAYTPIKTIKDHEDLHFNIQIIDGHEIYEPEISDRCYDYPIPCTGYGNENKNITLYSTNTKGIPKKGCLIDRIQFRGETLAEGFRRIP